MRNYEKRPFVEAGGTIITGWKPVADHIQTLLRQHAVIGIDCYTGVLLDELKTILRQDNLTLIDASSVYKSEEVIREMTSPFTTDDVLFGYMTPLCITDYFDQQKLAEVRGELQATHKPVLILGSGAACIAECDVLVYADMPRWELQLRMRRGLVSGLGLDDSNEPLATQYKRGLFNDWRVLDKHKQLLYEQVDFWLDTTCLDLPKIIDRDTFKAGLQKAVHMPFRVVPFFDPAPWGGQWMKEHFQLDGTEPNYGWCFDCVPEENSFILKVNGIEFEMPAVNLVYYKSRELLGEPVEARFGKEFPIRFDFLDTMEGGNLSLQVHPTVDFAHKNFGLSYTQDESYYLLEAGEGAAVYLGLKSGIDRSDMLSHLQKAQEYEDFIFDAEQFVNKFPAKKHDHFLIPAGTIHCSGKNTMVLEISATPFIYTFKLWDWGRLGLDGLPRPMNIERGKQVINWERDTHFTESQLVNRIEVVGRGEGWVEECTGLHRNEFIETRRHTFHTVVFHETGDSVNVLNLVDGEEIIVESTNHLFEPVIMRYAETFIVPAAVKSYSIRPHGPSAGKVCTTIKALIRN